MVETVAQIRKRAQEDAANTLQVHWQDLPMPVDPVVIARDLGIQVFTADIGKDDDTFGMLVQSGAGADMYLDRNQAPTRWRFTCAHEIGHYVDRLSTLSPEQTGAQVRFVDRRSDEGKGTATEIYANEFAGNLLMPESELARRVSQGHSDIALADHFDVSLQALRYRRKLLGI